MEILSIYLSPDHNYFGHYGKEPGTSATVEVDVVECVAGKGLVGDRFFDWKENYKGQATFFSIETHEWLCEQFQLKAKERDPSVFRRNILVRGVDLPSLVGETFEIQGVRFEGVEEARPCEWMNLAFAEGAYEALAGRGGLRTRILESGTLRTSRALEETGTA